MYRLSFYRTFELDGGFAFKRDSGYGVYVDGVEFAIARTQDGKWDITDVFTGMRVDNSHKTFPTRDSAIAWLRTEGTIESIKKRLEKHKDVGQALAEYKRPAETVTHEQVGDVTLTVKQSDFLTRYKQVIGTDGYVIRDLAGVLNMSPMSVGAMVSTLVEKGILSTFVEGNIKWAEPTELGQKIMEDLNG